MPLDTDARITRLEHQLKRTRRFLIAVVFGALALPLVAWTTATPEVIRVRGVIVVDEQGRERIVIGAPVPDPVEGRRIAAGTGLVINDTTGAERFGLNLFPNGRVVMGFDAPRGIGDDRNRERISIVADQHGNAFLRMLDRQTRARAFLQLEDDAVSLDLLHWRDQDILVRSISATNDTTTTVAR